MLSVFRLPALVLARDLYSISMTIFKLCCFKEALLLAAVSHVPTLNCERIWDKLWWISPCFPESVHPLDSGNMFSLFTLRLLTCALCLTLCCAACVLSSKLSLSWPNLFSVIHWKRLVLQEVLCDLGVSDYREHSVGTSFRNVVSISQVSMWFDVGEHKQICRTVWVLFSCM